MAIDKSILFMILILQRRNLRQRKVTCPRPRRYPVLRWGSESWGALVPGIMGLDFMGTLALWGPSFHKKTLNTTFYGCVGIKGTLIQTEFIIIHSFVIIFISLLIIK